MAELALEQVAVGQSGLEPFEGLGQRDIRLGYPKPKAIAAPEPERRRLLPFLLQFLRAQPGISGQGSGHRCSESGHLPTGCRKTCPGRWTLDQESYSRRDWAGFWVTSVCDSLLERRKNERAYNRITRVPCGPADVHDTGPSLISVRSVVQLYPGPFREPPRWPFCALRGFLLPSIQRRGTSNRTPAHATFTRSRLPAFGTADCSAARRR